MKRWLSLDDANQIRLAIVGAGLAGPRPMIVEETIAMTNESVTREDLDSLRRYDTPTICNALEIVAPERRARGFTTECLICVDPTLPPI